MKVLRSLIVTLLVLLGVSPIIVSSQEASAQSSYLMVGYIDAWTMATYPTAVNSVQFSKLTHAIFSDVRITSASNATLTSGWGMTSIDAWTDNVVAVGHAAGIDVLISLYSVPGDGLINIVDNATLRGQLVTNLTNYVAAHNLDGVDIDWEDISSYGARTDLLIGDLHAVLNPLGKIVTVCGGWEWPTDGINISVAASANVSFVNVMTYDMTYSPATAISPVHSSYADTVSAMTAWFNAGFAKSKLVMGVPFYGKDADGTAVLYGEIVDALAPLASQNQATVSSVTTPRGVISITGGVLWWSGIDLTLQKVDWMKANGYAGVMMYDVGEDKLNSSFSLLTNIYNALNLSGTPATLNNITLSPVGPFSLNVGVTQQMIATGNYSNNSTPNITLSTSWVSSVTSVATVSSSGVVTGVSVGTTNITASLSGITSANVLITVVGATQITPPSSLSTDSVRVFDNMFVTGDMYLVVRYDINYVTLPTPSATDTFDATLYSTNGITPLYTTTVKYYNHGIVGMYLNPAQSSTLVWGSAYVVKVEGDMSYFSPPLVDGITTSNHTLQVLDWWTGSQIQSRENLRTYLLPTLATQLQADMGVSIIGTSGKLNANGTTIFQASLPGIAVACPTIFETTTVNPVLTSANRTVTLSGTITGVFTGGETVRGSTSGVAGTFITGTQTTTSIQVMHSEVTMFYSGENVTGDASGAIVFTSADGVVVGKLEATTKTNTGARLRNTLNSLGAILGMSGNAVGGIILMLFYLLVAGAVFVATGSTNGAIAISLPVLFFGNYIGILAFMITWVLVIVAVTLFSILFIMERLP